MTATADEPDPDVDLGVQCIISGRYDGKSPVPLAKLRITLAGADRLPVCTSERIFVRQGDCDDWVSKSDFLVEDRAFWRAADGPTDDLHLTATVSLFPVDWVDGGQTELSNDSRADFAMPRRAGSLEMLSGFVGQGTEEEHSVRHTLSVCLRNTGSSTFALCAVRCVVRSQGDDCIANFLLYGESLNVGETRWLISDFSIPADSRGSVTVATASIHFGATETATVVEMPEQPVVPGPVGHGDAPSSEADSSADDIAGAPIPSQYESSSVDAKLSIGIWGTFEDGWNSEGVPANFEFPDGVLIRYMELDLEDPDAFAACYDRMTGYQVYTAKDPRALHAEGLKIETPLLFQFTLDFSTHPDLQGAGEELSVTINELQVGSDGPIAGSIVLGNDLDRDWLAHWFDRAIEEGWKVARL